MNTKNKTQEQREKSFGMHQLSRLDTIIYKLRIHSIKNHCACEGKNIIDLGCGYNADFLRYIQKKYKPALAIAYDLKLNKEMLKQTDIQCIQGDLNEPFKIEKKVDIIFATAILEHLHQPIKFLKQCYAILQPGGKLLLTTPSIRSQPVLEFLAYKLHVIAEEEIRDHKEYYDQDKLLQYCQEAGFEKQNIQHNYFECKMNNLIIAKKN